MNKTQKIKFAMDPEWIITGSIDAEQKEYKLMAYFQKMNVRDTPSGLGVGFSSVIKSV